jgi:hypothetical protein
MNIIKDSLSPAKFEPSSFRMKVQCVTAAPSKSVEHIVVVLCVKQWHHYTKVPLRLCFEHIDRLRLRGTRLVLSLSRKVPQIWHSSKFCSSCRSDQVSPSPPTLRTVRAVIPKFLLIYIPPFPFTKEFLVNSNIEGIISYCMWREGRDEFETPCCADIAAETCLIFS